MSLRRLAAACCLAEASTRIVPDVATHKTLLGPESGSADGSTIPAADAKATSSSGAVCDVYEVGDGARAVAHASLSPCGQQQLVQHRPDRGPRVLLKLVAAAKVSSSDSSIRLQLPRGTKWATASHTRQKQHEGHAAGWHAQFVAADDAALAAWGVLDLRALSQAMSSLLSRDAAFAETLSCVALSVAAPMGATSSSSVVSKDCNAGSGPHTPRGWSGMRVCSSYIRDPEDGTLQPALALLLLEPCSTGPTSQGLPLPEMRRSDTGATALKATGRNKRMLLRAATVLSAAPYISTFLELELPETSTRNSHSTATGCRPMLDLGTEDVAGLQDEAAPSGRVLLQNEGSLQYWGKLTSRNKTGSWQLLEELLQDTPGALPDLLRHLCEQRETHADQRSSQGGGAGAGVCGQRSQGTGLGLVAGAAWKKVVSVPSHNRPFSKILSDQVPQSRRAAFARDTGQAAWQAAGGASVTAANSVLAGLKPVQIRLPANTDGTSSPATPNCTSPGQGSSPSFKVLSPSRSRHNSIPEEQVLSVVPSRQVMSMMDAVSGTVAQQMNLTQRRVVRHYSQGVRSQGGSPRANTVSEGGIGLDSVLLPPTHMPSLSPSARASKFASRGRALSAPLGGTPALEASGFTGCGSATAAPASQAIDDSCDESDSELNEPPSDLHAIEEDDCDELLRYHEVQVVPLIDPVTLKEAVLLIQIDITSRALMEQRIAALTESQLHMLEGMFPRHILEFVMAPSASFEDLGSLAYQHPQVTILFMDVVGFTSMSKDVPPQKVMEFLNLLFKKFDNMLDTYGVYKVETAGDCYIVAGSLMRYDEDAFITLDTNPDGRRGARSVLEFAQAMLRHARTVTMPHNGQPTCVRVGIHTGSVTSGLIGTKLPKFGLFGDTMNTSSRMESTGRPGCVQISEAMYEMLSEENQSIFEPSGGVEVKGKGLMPTYIWTPTEQDLKLRPDDVDTYAEEAACCSPPPKAGGLSPADLSQEAYATTGAALLQANGLLARAKSTGVRTTARRASTGLGVSVKRTRWYLVRSVVEVVANKEQESRVKLVRSRLSRIASGAKSSPLLRRLSSSMKPRGGCHLVTSANANKQSSMMLVKEVMQLMKATMDLP